MFSFSARGRVADSTRRQGFLTRLRRDIRGNTFAIVGAALVPLTAMIGSGVDMSRAYMAKTRLQSACDAAALAGRRVMQNDTLNATVTNEATRFFRYNFPQGLYQTANFTPVVTRPSSGTVRVSASTTIPTAIMRMFGFVSLPLSVTCDASLSYVNTDVMLVLDTTGSMDDDINGNATSDDAARKITGLRSAVLALYDELRPTQTQLEANGLRLRYGILPYSSTVNVGALIRGVNPDYLADSVSYQTRIAHFDEDHPEYVGDPPVVQSPVTQTYSSSISQTDCDKYGRNVSFSGFSPSATTGGGSPPVMTWTRAFANNEATGVDWGWSGAPDTEGTNRTCRRRYTQTNTTYHIVHHYESSGYTYEDEPVDVSTYKMGTDVRMATNADGQSDVSTNFDPFEVAINSDGESGTNVRWEGCIMERETTPSITASSGYTIPAAANDLNVNMIPDPDDPDTQWRPFFPEIVYYTNGTRLINTIETNWACPYGAERLKAWTRAQMETYTNALNPEGYTYHDIGMIWGARMISPGGIFADSVDTFNGMPVSRHLIFMTDGQLMPNCSNMGAYGIEAYERRITNSSSCTDQYNRHMQRFRMMCNAVKGMNVSVWVIAFGTTLSSDMQSCASNTNQASTAGNSATLIQRFREIGSNIGLLRLTQ
jgi:Flp pilus assembly protein TadG